MRIAGGGDPSEGLKAGGTSAGRTREEGDDGILVLDISSRIYVLNIVRDVMHSLHILGHPLSQSQSADVERQCTAERIVAHRESNTPNCEPHIRVQMFLHTYHCCTRLLPLAHHFALRHCEALVRLAGA